MSVGDGVLTLAAVASEGLKHTQKRIFLKAAQLEDWPLSKDATCKKSKAWNEAMIELRITISSVDIRRCVKKKHQDRKGAYLSI